MAFLIALLEIPTYLLSCRLLLIFKLRLVIFRKVWPKQLNNPLEKKNGSNPPFAPVPDG